MSTDSLPPLNILTLGGLSIKCGDQPVTGFISRKVEALLLYLVLDPREHPREMLAELLWSNYTQTRATGNLRTTLSNLQSLLADYLIVTRQSIMINPDCPVWTDVSELDKIGKMAGGPLSSAATRVLEASLEYYKGEFLAGFHLREAAGFEQWLRQQDERLHKLVCEALQRLTDDALRHGPYALGIERARRWVSLDPYREEAHRSLMLLLAQSGQRAAAMAQYDHCVRLLDQELGAAPESETTRLFKQIEAQQISSIAPVEIPPIRLPIPATPFIERSNELNQILTHLDNPDCRLLTIVGPGGIGKTRLAIQAATNRTSRFRDGVYFISLVSVQSADFLPLEMASVLRYTFKGSHQPREELMDYLADREMLLVLDNFEHILPAGELIADILASTVNIKLLITSREWLNLQQEWVIPISGMAVPLDIAEDSASFSAVQLFMACAMRVRTNFLLDADRAAVIKICQLVEGMPLSIELAASWLRVIPAAEIAQQINVNFLATSSRNVPERHRSVRAVFDYSWKLLAPAEAQALIRLAVFKGPFDRAAAFQVASASIPILASLVEKSLLQIVDDQYYDIHELLRQYAFDRLVETHAVSETRDAHLNYFVSLTSDPDSLIHGQQQTAWLDRLDREHDNLRTALGWALEHDTPSAREAGLNLGASLWEFWLMRGHITEGRQWLDRLLAATEGTISIPRGSVTQGAGYLAYVQGESDRAEALHQEGLAMRRTLNDKAGMGGSLNNLGVVAWSRGDFVAARHYYEQALAVRREANYLLGMASVLNNLTLLLQDQGEYADAIAYAEDAFRLFETLDDLQGKVFVMLNLGALTYDQGDWERARTIQEDGLKLARQLGDTRVIGSLLQNLGQTVLSFGENAQAHKYLAESLELLDKTGDKTQIALAKKSIARLAVAESRFADAQQILGESIDLFKAVGATFYLGQVLTVQGDLYARQDRWVEAQSSYWQALAILFKTRNQQPLVEALYRLVNVAIAQSDLVRAVTLLSAADTFAGRLHIKFPGIFDQDQRDALRDGTGAEAYTSAADYGESLDLSSLVAYIGLQVDLSS